MVARPKCPDCPDYLDEHDDRCGCRHQKHGASGKLVICYCTRTTRKETR